MDIDKSVAVQKRGTANLTHEVKFTPLEIISRGNTVGICSAVALKGAFSSLMI